MLRGASFVEVGVAQRDITPSYPIRLSGYAARTLESQGVAQHLFAKAIAIGSDKEHPSVLITVENVGVPGAIRDEVAARLKKGRGIDSERFALCSTHTHTAPCLAGNLPTLFGEPLPPDQQAHIAQYTKELTDALEKVALDALKHRSAAQLYWAKGSAAFAGNRRTRGGPVDHDLPILVVKKPDGELKAVLLNYACHCTTLGGETNQICGDWAGYAQEYLQADHPGAIVLACLGCAGDANPYPRGSLDFAKQHGREIESSVNELLGHTLTAISGKLDCRMKTVELPIEKPRTKDQWLAMAGGKDKYAAYYARLNLEKLEHGETLPSKITYTVQSWNFGNDLDMIFLPGEVVVDYSLRLKKEFDAGKVWITAYANAVPCYIPSERILKEGGYEGGGAMVYYDWPNKFAPGIENIIVQAVHDVVPPSFGFDEHAAEFPPPKSLREALASFQTEAGFEVQLAASEPLIVDPVAIDWGPDGKLWVVEMRDYPIGTDGKWKPGSRVKYLEDTNGDGVYDEATVLLDDLPFATGVTAWRNGVLVCSAPDILYAEDLNRGKKVNGKSAPPNVTVKKVFTGFFTENYQARVNSLSLGLDNWVYGANGLLGGVIHGVSRGIFSPKKDAASAVNDEIDIRGRDFRINPDNGKFEAASGLTQQGRVRDDWGNWFGCDNSTLAWHYPLPDHYIRRNPFVVAPSPRISIAAGEDPNLLHPISRMLERFNSPQSAGRVTSGCGIGLYRDDIFGPDFVENAFVCEPVHNLVHRLKLEPQSVTFSGIRPRNEQHSEFFASRDNWCRPVQARTGPDGALYIVDMYRFVIEHPRWIPAERLAKLDVRAGDDKGRIYRIAVKGKPLRSIPDLRKLSPMKLVNALDTPNGTERDRVHQEILFSDRTSEFRKGSEAEKCRRRLEKLAVAARLPEVRLQASCVLDGLGSMSPKVIDWQLADCDARVRANAIRLAEQFFNDRSSDPQTTKSILQQVCDHALDSDFRVRFQLALSLGEAIGTEASETLSRLAASGMTNAWMRAAILSSSTRAPETIFQGVLKADAKTAGRSEMIRDLIATGIGSGDSSSVGNFLAAVAPIDVSHRELWQLASLEALIEALDRKNISVKTVSRNCALETQKEIGRLDLLFEWSRELATNSAAKDSVRDPAIHLLGRDPAHADDDAKTLLILLDAPISTRLQTAVLGSMRRMHSPALGDSILQNWSKRSPALRQSCIETLLTRDEWVATLLTAVENGTVGKNEISPANRQRLLRHRDTGVQQQAAAIWNSQNNTRAQVLAKYQPVTTMSGDALRGSLVFSNTCSSCHSLKGIGHSVGPNLAPLADKSTADFLTAILDPNAAVEPRFIAYNIDTKDGRSLTGVVSAETSTTLTLVQGGGAQEKLLRGDIDSIRASGLSLMPEGLEQNLTQQNLADLIAFLKSH
jgi:putative membrane-bound dehydrogenase-like protein